MILRNWRKYIFHTKKCGKASIFPGKNSWKVFSTQKIRNGKKNRFFHSKILGKLSNYIFHSENSGKAFFHAKIAEKYFSTKKIRNDEENLIFRLIKWGQDFPTRNSEK